MNGHWLSIFFRLPVPNASIKQEAPFIDLKKYQGEELTHNHGVHTMPLNRTILVSISLILAVIAYSDDTRAEDMASQLGTKSLMEVPAAPEDGGPRNWQVADVSSTLNLREQPSITARIIASYTPGTI
ncbi:MAG: hypothetical protein V2I40_01540, partial [Desulfobacteraceae bacterium]|nr:hypothetical protein [Desulfobacteraceae bacterium]